MFSSRFLFFAAIPAAFALGLASPAQAATYYVSTCGNDAWVGVNVNCIAPLGPKRTVQAAINVANDGDVINIMPGTYLGTIDLDGKAITLVGLAGAATTIIDGNGDGPVVTCNSLEGSDTVLQGLTIRGGRTQQSGAGMLNALSSPTIVSCVFHDNRAWVSGGGIANFAASPTIIDCTFTQNWANNSVQNNAGTGGAISIQGGSPEITGCDFSNNTARFHGGALSVAGGGSPDIEDCTFTSNALLVSGHGVVGVAPAMGSAIFVQASNPTFDGCDVSGNIVMARGAIGVYGGSPSFVACTISNNVSHMSKGATGGGMYAINGANVSLLGCQFAGNDSREDGGALKVVSSTVSATLCGFMENEGSTWGGGAIGVNDANATFAACTIVDNHSNTRAGAIYAVGSSLILDGCTISTNDAATQAGAIYAGSTDLTIESCSFNGNISNGAGDTHGGGAITFEGEAVGVATIHDTTFTGNSAKAGGGVQLNNGEMNFAECVFESNHATDDGGGITSVPIAYLNVTNSQFLDNSTDGVGGGVMCNANTNVIGCLFSGNSAVRGGAVRSDEGAWAHSHFFGCRFIDNTASECGAAVQLDNGAFIWMANCIVEDNTAPVGKGAIGIVAGVAILDLTNCAVANNTGGGLYLDDTTPASRIKNSIIWGNINGGSIVGDMPSVRFSNVQGGAPGVGNISADPLFQNVAIGDYALTAGSPCIDAGANWAMIPDSIDLDDDGDTTELLPLDYNGNPRFADNPAANTGCGGGTMIDMGPIESPGAVSPSVTPGDVNGDGVINVTDLLAVIAAWGPCPAGACCPADFNLDGQINVTDLLTVIANWG